MTNKYEPLDTRVLNGVLGLVWILWTLFKWVVVVSSFLLIPAWVYFAWIDDPVFTIVVLLAALVVVLMYQLTKRPRKRTHV